VKKDTLIAHLMQRLTSLPKLAVVVLAWALMVLIGSMDYMTGRDFALSAFYLAPISWVCWMTGRRAAVTLAVASAISWLIGELMLRITYRHPLTPYWNALMLLMFFLVVVYLLSAFQTAHYHLEETVQRRTAALEAEIQERKRLEAANLQAERLALVGTMAAQVAHEVRNPLGSITLNLDLIQKEITMLTKGGGHSSDESRQLVLEMREEIQRIQRVLEEYLQFARLPKPQLREVKLNEMLGQKLDFIYSEFEKARVKPLTHFDPAAGVVRADAEQLWQATLNLIRNSLEAMADGGELTIGTWREGGWVRLRVTDTGKGMGEEHLKKLFAPFFTTKPTGTGLGLALVQQIATEHGGHVECESAVGKGTTFTIFLPKEKAL
jgi:signal transduction histidine kinase